ncbi:TetR family transcriptional regulator [Murinocardiopsis flavida]|uniref:TetR family transcriptional regulator n=1 Tax=Murinocardiopsis flavida TaxID=645275 RepID=A0A2P8DLB4_9ACTN|nr:TetR/AcrR family transcriptional regulator [Murinocardiopsis flavida]PSK98017.1 TetR family transcriptional regulator [Murinocardiopsis flavida]
MPNSTDGRDTARLRILDAVFRLVERNGVAEASLRKVAAESGINIGSVRHYFGSHEALMAAAATEIGARMDRRADPASMRPVRPGDTAGRRALLQQVADSVLPAEPEGGTELLVLGEFVAAARIRPEFRPLAERMGRDLRALVRDALRLAGVPDTEVQTEHFVGLLIGLSFELVYPHGSTGSPAPRDVVRHHIAALVPG